MKPFNNTWIKSNSCKNVELLSRKASLELWWRMVDTRIIACVDNRRSINVSDDRVHEFSIMKRRKEANKSLKKSRDVRGINDGVQPCG